MIDSCLFCKVILACTSKRFTTEMIQNETGGYDHVVLSQRSFQKYLSEVSKPQRDQATSPYRIKETVNVHLWQPELALITVSAEVRLARWWQKHLSFVWQGEEWPLTFWPMSVEFSFGLRLFALLTSVLQALGGGEHLCKHLHPK